MNNPQVALETWIRVTKPGGHLIITIPEENLYEHGKWPSRFNGDHKYSFSIHRTSYNMPSSIFVMKMLTRLYNINIKKIELIDDFFNPNDTGDQTRTVTTECSIEIILQKKIG